LSDIQVRRGRPPKDAIKSGMLEEPYEANIIPMPRGWDIAIKFPRVPVGAFLWVQDSGFAHDMLKLFPRCIWEIGYDTALDGGVIMITLHYGEYAAKENFNAREASYDDLADMLRDYVAKHSGELSGIAKRIRLYVGAE
jgi:hypothetical protein